MVVLIKLNILASAWINEVDFMLRADAVPATYEATARLERELSKEVPF